MSSPQPHCRGLLLGLLALLLAPGPGPLRGIWGAQDTDRFTYQDTDTSGSYALYGPADWDRVGCNDLATCPGWPDKYLAAIDWQLDSNDCQWCPADGSNCGTHHQSPINLERNRAINESEWHNQCIDVHWMKYYDSSCTWDELVRLNAFSIERHALRLTQPIEIDPSATDSGGATGAYRNACEDPDGKHYFGRIDFSKGFSQWWHLSHMNLRVPSEHTQEGRRYDGELQFHHFYSVSAAEAGVSNQMSTLAIFLQAYDDAPDYDVLNKLICQWRRVEDATREECGLPSVESYYPGCFFNTRGHDDAASRRNLRRKAAAGSKATSLQDLVAQEHRAAASRDAPAASQVSLRDDFEEPEDFDWDEFVREVYRQEEERAGARHLLDYDHIGPWHNYFGMLGVKTEYYFRYSGTQTIPPCYGIFTAGNNRANTNHWRVMKDPIRVSVRQIDELHRLLKDRIAPSDDPISSCQPDTAAAPYEGNENRVNVSRPLMATDKAHFMTFCECRWGSKWAEDQLWCDDKNQTSRLYDHPYNFPADSF